MTNHIGGDLGVCRDVSNNSSGDLGVCRDGPKNGKGGTWEFVEMDVIIAEGVLEFV